MSNKDQAAKINRAEKTATRSSASSTKFEDQAKLSSSAEVKQTFQQTRVDPQALHPHDLLRLQRSVGNRAVQRLLTTRTLQAKLTVGAAHDPYEEEADAVAGQVMRMSAAPIGNAGPVQRATEEDKEELQAKPLADTITPLVQRTVQEEELQTKLASAADSFDTSKDFESRLNATRGGGTPLPDPVRDFMEPRFGADFSGVRLHTDGESAQLNREVSAQAFTLGSDIYLGEGQNDLASNDGKQLLAHELTHVVQQSGSLRQHPLTTLRNPTSMRRKSNRIGLAERPSPPIKSLRGAPIVQRLVSTSLRLGDPVIIKKHDQIGRIISTYVNGKYFVTTGNRASSGKGASFGKYDGAYTPEELNFYKDFDYQGRDQIPLPVLKSKFNILKRLDKSAFDEAVKEQGAVGYADDISKMGEYDRARGFQKGVFTAEMDNCITVGFTAKTQTARINAILHSMQGGQGVVADIFEQLDSLMSKIKSELGQPEDVQYYVVGGNAHPESQAKATEILQHLLLNDLPVMGIALPTDQSEAHLMKGVLNTAGGEVVYTTYEPKKTEKKEEVPVQLGFSGFTSAKNLFSKDANK